LTTPGPRGDGRIRLGHLNASIGPGEGGIIRSCVRIT
jgi:hypothetical protein